MGLLRLRLLVYHSFCSTLLQLRRGLPVVGVVEILPLANRGLVRLPGVLLGDGCSRSGLGQRGRGVTRQAVLALALLHQRQQLALQLPVVVHELVDLLRQLVIVLPPLNLVHEILDQLRLRHRQFGERISELRRSSLAALVPPMPIYALRISDLSALPLALEALLYLLFVGRPRLLLGSRLYMNFRYYMN